MYGFEHIPEGTRKVTVSLMLLCVLPVAGYKYGSYEKDKEIAQLNYQHDQEMWKQSFENTMMQVAYNRERSDKIVDRETTRLDEEIAAIKEMLQAFIAEDLVWREELDERIDEVEARH